MNKFLAITALSALAFTGCMDDDNGKWKEQQQVMPGLVHCDGKWNDQCQGDCQAYND